MPVALGFPSVRDLLAAVTVAKLPDGTLVPWHRPSEGAVVSVVAHSSECEPCRQYLRTLVHHVDGLRLWGGRPVALLPDDSPAARELARELPFPVLWDLHGDARWRWGVDPGDAGVLVADRWGLVYESWDVGTVEDGHCFPDPAALVEVVLGIGIQCPECGVPDVPNGLP